ncbi:unnamed protein product [Porites evermanni]|uniref:UDENN FLCN/SMCR8-type domain-containing protein n=1 Tax=Porites evermanni TaxID=104178 RepID=A0ABN8NC79_9CNID|nr:unnamed protein product [Porites evermanni]
MTIPKNGGGHFDLNAFAVHVMSVDYTQARGTTFSIVEDTQLLLSEKKEGVYAYVHHFTLYDIHARGFVRPYCMCYISKCKRKMYSFLDRLMDEFTKVSRLFRHGNRITFIRDLELRLAEVLAMKGLCLCTPIFDGPWEGEKKETKPVFSFPPSFARNIFHRERETSGNLSEDYDYIVKETRKLIEVLKPHMVRHDSKIVQEFKRLENLAEGRSRSCTDTTVYSLINRGKSCHKSPLQPPLRRAVSLPDLKNLSANRQVHSTFNMKPKSCLPSYLNSIKHLRHLHELCEWGAKEGLNRLRTILKYYSRETAALLIEQTETSHLDHFPSLLTIGRSVVCNVLHKTDLKCISKNWPKKSCQDPPADGCFTRKSSNTSLYSLESFQSCLEEEMVGSFRSTDGIISPFSPSSSFHADLQGGDKLESLSYGSSDDSRTENSDVMSVHSDSSVATAGERLLSTEYTLVGEDAPSEGTHPRLRRIRSTVSEERTEMPHSPPSGLSRSLGSINTTFSDAGSLRSQRTHNETVPHIPILRSNISIKMTSPKGDKSPCTSGVEASPRSMNSRNNLSVRNAFIRSKSDGSSGSSSPSREEKLSSKRLPYSARPERVRLRCFAEEVSQPLETYTGSNLLLLRNNWSCGVHLLYALLCGRPVVVLGEPRNEREVRVLVSALWMFVPENMSHGRAVAPWRTKPLQIADLSWLKLAGLAKSRHLNMVPKSVKRYVSMLDYEKDLIVTPQYKGHYLRSFCNYASRWPSNAALVAFVHSVFLELASKSYVYYYNYCLGGLHWCYCKRYTCGLLTVPDASDVLNRLRVHFSDAKVVQYFAELIKQQQIDFFPSLSPDEDYSHEGPDSSDLESPSLLITTDLSKCAIFQNLRPLELL